MTNQAKPQELENKIIKTAQEVEELGKKQEEIKKIKEQKVKEIKKLEAEYSKLSKKKYFYCGTCQGNCKGLEKGYFH